MESETKSEPTHTVVSSDILARRELADLLVAYKAASISERRRLRKQIEAIRRFLATEAKLKERVRKRYVEKTDESGRVIWVPRDE